MNKKFKLFLFFLFAYCQVQAKTPIVRVKSPDGKTRLEITVDHKGQLVYRTFFSDKPVLIWSDLGFQTGQKSVGENTKILKQTRRQVNERFAWRLGEKDTITNHFQELILDCRSADIRFKVVSRVFNGSVAFRYYVPEQTTFQKAVILKELTSFNFADESILYRYNEESVFVPTAIDTLKLTCDFPATLTSKHGYISIGEADNSAYTKARLIKGAENNSLGVSFGKDSVSALGDFLSPWRTVSFATSAVGLHAFSDLGLRLSSPSKEAIPDWIKPGKLIRSALTTQAAINCIDFAARNHFQYMMFDAGWYGAEFRGASDPTKPIDAIDMPRVIQYGKEHGIGIILYVNRVALRARLDEILPLYKQWGVAGLKFGFVDGISQEGITWLEGAIRKTYAHGFVLDIHDNYKPTGLSRTYPNLLTQEGIRGNENNPDAFHNTVLPFTRFLAGAADYTFCYPNGNSKFSENLYKTKLQVSKGQQLALSVVYFSPLQAIFWYGNPLDYTDPTEIEFFTKVPTVWNESHYLKGEIGKFISVARRSGKTWYLGTVAGKEDWNGNIDLDFLESGKTYILTGYEDDDSGSIKKKRLELEKGNTLPVKLKAGQGLALIIEPQS